MRNVLSTSHRSAWMRRLSFALCVVASGLCCCWVWVAWAQPTTQPTTKPATKPATQGAKKWAARKVAPATSPSLRPKQQNPVLSEGQKAEQKALILLLKSRTFRVLSREAERYTKKYPGDGVGWYLYAKARYHLQRKPPYVRKDIQATARTFARAISLTSTKTCVPVLSWGHKHVLHWEAHMATGHLFYNLILDAFLKHMRKQRRLPQKKRQAVTFVPNSQDLAKAKAAYVMAAKVHQPNRFKRTLPFLQIGFLYGLLKKDYQQAVRWLHKAEAMDDRNLNVVGNLKMLYDRLQEDAENNGDHKLAEAYRKKSMEYDAKVAALRGAR